MKNKWNADRLVSLSAIGISFFTLVIFIYQTNLLSRQNYISIMPYLAISTTHNAGKHVFELNLKNHGVGPAIIESVMLDYKGKRYNLVDYENEIHKFLASISPELSKLKNISHGTLGRGMAIPANSTYNVLGVHQSPEDYELMTGTLDELLTNGLKFQIIYKSIQDERWLINNDSEGPRKLK